ncbi:MAG: type III toxin-antitoxin system ToxN/AbiQ family toxin [Clostridia bacterium]|nr:type III toxin-antitoxin system ToxN/AbiQ family toxin [Clostridia bacterium]
MKERMNIYYLDKAYQDYIKPHTNSGKQTAVKEDSKRRTSGVVLFGFGGTTNYFIPLRVGEVEQEKVELGLSYGLNKGKNGYLEFSSMLPVQNKDLHLMDISNLPTCNLKKMLQRQARYVQREQKKIMEGASEVYLHCVHYPESKIASQCNDILLLEEKEYLWREGKVIRSKKEEHKVEQTDTKKANDQKVLLPTEKTYRETSTYKKAVEKYGKKVAEKMISDALLQALTQEKKEVKCKDIKSEKKQVVSSPKEASKNTSKKSSTTAKKSSDKGTVTTVTIKSSPAKGK